MQKSADKDIDKRIMLLRSQCGVYGRSRDTVGAAEARSALDGALIEREVLTRWDRLDVAERTRLAALLAGDAA